MSTLTLVLIIFFTLYDGIGSKLKHPNVDQVGKWIDRNAILFIRYFGFTHNRDLFPILQKICLKLCGVFFASSAVTGLLGILPHYSSFGFVFTFLLLIPLTSYKQLKNEIINGIKTWIRLILIAILGLIFYRLILDQKTFQKLVSPFVDYITLAASQMNVEIPAFIAIMIFTFVVLMILYAFYWIVTKGILWISVIPLKYYAKLCFILNKRQPLKPLYLISKSIILLVVHFATL